jgi:hypothetical protein
VTPYGELPADAGLCSQMEDAVGVVNELRNRRIREIPLDESGASRPVTAARLVPFSPRSY